MSSRLVERAVRVEQVGEGVGAELVKQHTLCVMHLWEGSCRPVHCPSSFGTCKPTPIATAGGKVAGQPVWHGRWRGYGFCL